MMLRLQRERMAEGLVASLDDYHRDYGLDAERLRCAVRDMNIPQDGTILHVTVSIGLSTLTPDIGRADAMIKAADMALYRAKQSGRDRVCRHWESIVKEPVPAAD